MTIHENKLAQIRAKVLLLHESRERFGNEHAAGWDRDCATQFIRDVALILDIPFMGKEDEP